MNSTFHHTSDYLHRVEKIMEDATEKEPKSPSSQTWEEAEDVASKDI